MDNAYSLHLNVSVQLLPLISRAVSSAYVIILQLGESSFMTRRRPYLAGSNWQAAVSIDCFFFHLAILLLTSDGLYSATGRKGAIVTRPSVDTIPLLMNFSPISTLFYMNLQTIQYIGAKIRIHN